MGTFTAGSVVRIPFPFSDLSQTKLRPAVIIALLDKGDCILCQITSQPYDVQAIKLDDENFKTGYWEGQLEYTPVWLTPIIKNFKTSFFKKLLT